MGGFWLDVLGFVVVFLVVFMLIVSCEHERHEVRRQQNDHR